jgi:hypothetical protein
MKANVAIRFERIAVALVAIGSFALTSPARLGAELAAPPSLRWRTYHAAFEPGDGSVADLPSAALVAGRRGQALRLGKGAGMPELTRQGIVDLSRPGAITCWIRPVDWQAPAPSSEYVPVIRVLGHGPAALIVERDRRTPGRLVDVWIAGYFSLASRGEIQIQKELTSLWVDSGWHFIVLQWDSTGFSLQIDDTGPIRTAVPAADLASEFPKAASHLVIGSGTREGLLVDELSVWSRPLEIRELKALRVN